MSSKVEVKSLNTTALVLRNTISSDSIISIPFRLLLWLCRVVTISVFFLGDKNNSELHPKTVLSIANITMV